MGCDGRVIWGVVPNGELAIPVCGECAGFVMENVFLRRGAEYGFAYVAKHDMSKTPCHGRGGGRAPAMAGGAAKAIELKAEHEVLTTKDELSAGPKVGVSASTRVVG
jgi:hypothetical protein